jgi:chitosanase
MPITIQQKKKILQVVNVFETGSANGNYASVTLLQDGPIENGKPIKQITYGRSQTTEFGNLKALLQEYVKKNGTFSNAIEPFLPQIGKKPSLCTNKKFLQILKDSALKDPIMAQTQDVFFDTLYYQPAFRECSLNCVS